MRVIHVWRHGRKDGWLVDYQIYHIPVALNVYVKYGGPQMIKIDNSAAHQNLFELFICLFHAFYVAKLTLLMLL